MQAPNACDEVITMLLDEARARIEVVLGRRLTEDELEEQASIDAMAAPAKGVAEALRRRRSMPVCVAYLTAVVPGLRIADALAFLETGFERSEQARGLRARIIDWEPSEAVAACWDLMIEGLARELLHERDLIDIVGALRSGDDRVIQDVGFEIVGDELCVSFGGDCGFCAPAAFAAEIDAAMEGTAAT
jgi:hypothetical protein